MCRVVCKDTSIISFGQFIQTENFYFLTKKINFGTQGNLFEKKVVTLQSQIKTHRGVEQW